jgi:hypothetical protein
MMEQAKAKPRGRPKQPMSAEWHRANEEIGRRLRILRAEWARLRPRPRRGKPVSQDLPRHLGVSPRSWHNWERGCHVPGPSMLRLVVVTGCRPEWLLSGDGAMYREEPAPRPAVEAQDSPSNSLGSQ